MPVNGNINYQEDIDRAQMVRLWDVFGIGPILIIIGLLKSTPVPAKIALIVIGLGTIVYNGYFYLKYKS